jgi:hypothetical protein
MKLSQGEKLILLALASAQDGKERLDLDCIRSAIMSGNTWALSWELQGVSSEENDERIAAETAEILGMWTYIEHSLGQLSESDREKLEKDAQPYSSSFEGFDGNHDPHYGIASFLINDMNRFDEYQGRALNSHSQVSLPRYRRMLAAYSEARTASGLSSRSFSAPEILNILRAG